MDTNQQPQAAAPNDTPCALELSQLLQSVQQTQALLEKQARHNKTQLLFRTVQSALLLALVLIVGVGVLRTVSLLTRTTQDVPTLVADAQSFVLDTNESLGDVLTQVNSIDFDALNTTIRDMQLGVGELRDGVQEMRDGIGAVDFAALGNSIKDLEKVAQQLALFLRIFG